MNKINPTNGFQMIKIYSPSQAFVQFEVNSCKSTMNTQLPKWKGFLNYINSYQTECLIVIGLVVDDIYDAITI